MAACELTTCRSGALERRTARGPHGGVWALFEIDQTSHDPDAALAHGLGRDGEDGDAEGFAQTLVAGVLDNKSRIDEIVAEA